MYGFSCFFYWFRSFGILKYAAEMFVHTKCWIVNDKGTDFPVANILKYALSSILAEAQGV